MDPQIAYLLSCVANRFRTVHFAKLLAVCWLIIAVAAIGLSQLGTLPQLNGWYFLATIGVIASLWLGCKFLYRDRRWIANRIEEQFPSLKQRLITAIQTEQLSTSSYLSRALVNETINHSRTNDWRQTISTGSMRGAWISQFLAFALASVTGFFVYSNEGSWKKAVLKQMSLVVDSGSIKVEPGDAEMERGSDVVISVRFANEIPDEAWIDSEYKTGEKARHAMRRSLKDPLFGGYLRNLQIDQLYRIDYLTGASSVFKIKVFEYPALTQSDAKIESPKYSKLSDKEIADTRRVSVVDGATLTWKCQMNKPVSVAELVDQTGNTTPLVASKDNPLMYEASFVMTESQRWKIRLVDQDQRATKFEEELSAKVIPNGPPETKLVRAQDQNVSALQELQMQATAKDDFGIQRSGLTFMLGDAEPTEVTIPVGEPRAGKVELSHLIDMEALQAKPDQLLSYYFWAEDLDRDGDTRRVDGDMFFAEVRPFDEIFREGESMSSEQKKQQEQQKQSEGAQKAEELAELQKQIISGTWNVIRREKSKSISKTFAADTQLLVESQQEAFEMTDKLAEKIEDAQSEKYLEQVRDAMTAAKDLLGTASIDSDLMSLRAALRKELEAYEGLLRLRAREHQIVQSQQQQQQKSSKSGAQKNRQQQIDQLKLNDDENRYETEQRADAAEPTAERETRQVMNRLAELAKRQDDLNEQVKNLETALQEAKTEETKKELEEQLKRLRENQEELLRDSDEVLERMNQPENRQAMEGAREQTEQARSDMQKSSEALSKGETSPAISSGTRAQRQMDETKEQLRQSSSIQLERTMRDLVQDAKRIEEQQKKLDQKIPSASRTSDPKLDDANTLNPSDESASPLRPEGDSAAEQSTRKDWQEQKKDLKQLLEKMQETVSEAESSEPLLAEKLYESFRESKQKGLEQRMDQIPILVERGLEEPARRVANELNDGIRSLKENIEKAAEDVLGSEEQSLRRALAELERARRQLDTELNARDLTPVGEQSSGNRNGGALQRLAPSSYTNGPLTGENYSNWVDSLRDVEELVSDPEMKAEAARIRGAAREMRVDYKRHSKEPQWPLVRKLIAEPIGQLRERLQEELLRKSSERNAIVPVDHDPVPSKYQQQQDRYYENLGGAKNR